MALHPIFQNITSSFMLPGSGNHIIDLHEASQVKSTVCEHCDCVDGHECLLCGAEIGENGCKDREGMCIDCFDTEQWAAKN